MAVPHALLYALSLLYLATVMAFLLGLNEQESWPSIWRETKRRWIKLVGALAGIGAATMALTFLANWL